MQLIGTSLMAAMACRLAGRELDAGSAYPLCCHQDIERYIGSAMVACRQHSWDHMVYYCQACQAAVRGQPSRYD